MKITRSLVNNIKLPIQSQSGMLTLFENTIILITMNTNTNGENLPEKINEIKGLPEENLVDWKHFNIAPGGYEAINRDGKLAIMKELISGNFTKVFKAWLSPEREVFLLEHPIYITILYELEEHPITQKHVPDVFKVAFVPGDSLEKAMSQMRQEEIKEKEQAFKNRFGMLDITLDKLEVNPANLSDIDFEVIDEHGSSETIEDAGDIIAWTNSRWVKKSE